MQTVHLVGNISKFGKVWQTDCANIRDIFKLINCQTLGFNKYLIEAEEAGVAYEIRKGKDILQNPEDLLLSTVEDEDIIITEVPDGAKKGLKIVAGIILVVIGVFTGIPFLTEIGISLIVGGVTELLAPGPETEESENDPSYLFNGPVNNITQGLPIPVLYGQLIIGGGAISAFYSNSPVILRGDIVDSNSTGTNSFGNTPIPFGGGEGPSVQVASNASLRDFVFENDLVRLSDEIFTITTVGY